jgi:hypothetical protein
VTAAHKFARLGLLAIALMLPASLSSQSRQPSEEYRLKAAFVYRFPQFVEWPAPALDGQESVTICVLRPNPFGSLLGELITGETLNGRSLAIQEIDRASGIHGCHVVFVPGEQPGAAKAVLDAAGDHPILTIGESSRFLDDGGVINLQVINRRVRFEINATAAERAGLRLSSQLLRLAIRVRGAA